MLVGETAIIRCFGEKALEVGSVVKGAPETAATVEYTVSLLSKMHIRDMFGDGEVIKRRYFEGEGEFPIDCPIEDCTVRVHWIGRLKDGTEFEVTAFNPVLINVGVEVLSARNLTCSVSFCRIRERNAMANQENGERDKVWLQRLSNKVCGS